MCSQLLLVLWLAVVLGSCVSQHWLAACCVLAAVAGLCGLHWCRALLASTGWLLAMCWQLLLALCALLWCWALV